MLDLLFEEVEREGLGSSEIFLSVSHENLRISNDK